MKGLLSTAASRAWLGVMIVGLIVIVVVIGLQLHPRLSAGQSLVDATKPVMTDRAVVGEVAGTRLLSRYVDLADPLLTKGGGASEVSTLILTIARRTGGSQRRARALLRRAAPHTEALLRALPFSGIVRERDRFTGYLSSALNITEEELQGLLASSFPRLFATLSELPGVTGGWRNVPGMQGLTRFDGSTVVKTVPDYRDYLRDDLVGALRTEHERVQALAGSGGIGTIPIALLVLGGVLAAFGLLHARWSVNGPSGKVAWGFVAALGVVTMATVGALALFPRLNDAERTLDVLRPAFDERRAGPTRAGIDLVAQSVRFGDPIMTAAGGAAAEVPKLVALVADRTGQSTERVRGRLADAAPRISALLQAIPLSAVAGELPRLLAVLSRELGMGGDRLVATLRRRTPGLSQAILAAGPVTAGWRQIPGTQDLTRLDTATPVRSIPELAGYLDEDVVPLIEAERRNFERFAGPWPPISVLPGVVLAIGVLLTIYATAMLFLVTKPPPRY